MVNPKKVKDSKFNNYKVDVNSLYNSFIKEIDAVRSIISIEDAPGLLTQLKNDAKNAKTTTKPLNLTSEKKESRCHAFYRLVGLPIVANDDNYYSPGFDYETNGNKEVINKKIQIINLLDPITSKISSEREIYFFKKTTKWFKDNSLVPGLTVMSSYNVRDFASIFKESTDPLKPGAKEQGYTVDENFIDDIKLSLFLVVTDEQWEAQSDELNSSLQRNHYIRPLCVDPRIDLTVKPDKNRMAVPFAKDDNLKLNDTTYFKKPLIEKICRERLFTKNKETSNDEKAKELIEYLSTDEKDQEIIKEINEKLMPEKSLEGVYSKYILMLDSIIEELVKAQKTIEQSYTKYRAVPVPNSNGPEFGCEIRPLDVKNENGLGSELDKSIYAAVAKLTLDQLMFKLTGTKEEVSSDEFAFSDFSVLDDDNDSGFGDKNEKILRKKITERNDQLKKSNDAFRTIEIITGEFSGLGLIDIICLLASLYVMPIDNLLGLLDQDALKRMRNVKSLKADGATAAPVVASLTVLSETMKQFYHLTDSLYQIKSKKQ